MPIGTSKKVAAAAPVAWPFASVFMHADVADIALMVLGLVGDGLSTPMMLFLANRILNDIGTGPDRLLQFTSKMNENVRNILYLAACNWAMAFLEGYCWTPTQRSGKRHGLTDAAALPAGGTPARRGVDPVARVAQASWIIHDFTRHFCIDQDSPSTTPTVSSQNRQQPRPFPLGENRQLPPDD